MFPQIKERSPYAIGFNTNSQSKKEQGQSGFHLPTDSPLPNQNKANKNLYISSSLAEMPLTTQKGNLTSKAASKVQSPSQQLLIIPEIYDLK